VKVASPRMARGWLQEVKVGDRGEAGLEGVRTRKVTAGWGSPARACRPRAVPEWRKGNS